MPFEIIGDLVPGLFWVRRSLSPFLFRQTQFAVLFYIAEVVRQ